VVGTSDEVHEQNSNKALYGYGRFLALGCGSPEPLAVLKVEDDLGGGGGTPSDSKLSISFIAFCISESCSRRSRTGLS